MGDNAINAASVPSEGKRPPAKGKMRSGSFARVPIAALRKDDYAWPSHEANAARASR
jgi:hypothetical protein